MQRHRVYVSGKANYFKKKMLFNEVCDDKNNFMYKTNNQTNDFPFTIA